MAVCSINELYVDNSFHAAHPPGADPRLLAAQLLSAPRPPVPLLVLLVLPVRPEHETGALAQLQRIQHLL